MRVIERVLGRYDIQEVEFGRVYRWRPGRVVVECDCGERLALTGSKTACSCGADYAATVDPVVRRPENGAAHPWRSSGETRIPF